MLSWVYAAERPEELNQQPAVEVLHQVWIQQYYQQGDKNGDRRRIYVRFARASCRACPVRTHCTRSAEDPRTLSFNPKEQ